MSDSILFTPLSINGMTLRNRIVLPSMVTCHAAINGEVTDKLIQWHAERAQGGCGLNMLEATSMSMGGNSYRRGVGIASDAMIPGLTRLTAAVHTCDGKIGIQLQHGGRTAIPASSGHPILLVSHVPGLTPWEESRVLTRDDIATLVEEYAAAAGRAVKAGFDVVELHGAHGYLVNQFLSPHTNHREDEYGGSLENRLRFPLEVLRAVRAEVGPAYPVTMRLSVEEFVSDGITLPMALDIAQAFVGHGEEHGVDALHISVGIAETNQFTIPPSSVPEGWNADRASAVKNAVGGRVPIIAAGRIVNRRVAEAILASGKADLVAMGRALIADPYLPEKLASGMDADILPCVGCNDGCVGAMGRNEPVTCAVNPRAGHEGRFPLVRASVRKRVVVTGGGPGGMQAALTAARRGHDVILLEKADHLGGLLNAAMLPPHKQAYGDLLRSLAHALDRAGADIRLTHEANAASIAALSPDTVLVAEGSEPLFPRFCQNCPVVPAVDLLQQPQNAGKRVLVLGGGLVGCELAEFLAEQGKKVTLLELRDQLAVDMEVRSRTLLLPRLAALGVRALLHTEVQSIAPGTVTARDSFGDKIVLADFDTLALALGYRPRHVLQQALSAAGMSYTPLGDCILPGKVMAAIHQGHRLAYEL